MKVFNAFKKLKENPKTEYMAVCGQCRIGENGYENNLRIFLQFHGQHKPFYFSTMKNHIKDGRRKAKK